MKIKGMILLVLIFILTLHPFSAMAASRATVQINMINLLPISELKKLNVDDLGALIITDMKEAQDYYYFLLSDGENKKGMAVLRVRKEDFSTAKIICIEDTAELKGYTIDSMSIGSNGSMWLNLSGQWDRLSCKIDRDGQITTVTYGLSSTVKHGRDSILWYQGTENLIYRWDGEHTQTYEISNPSMMDFVEHEDQLYYINHYGDLYRAKEFEDIKVADLLVMYDLAPEGEMLETASLASVGGKLWASVGIRLYPHIGLLNLTDHTKIEQIAAGKIYKAFENGDGSLYFLIDEYYPIVPNQYPGHNTFYQLTLDKNSQWVIDQSNGNWQEIEQPYIDIEGNVWTYQILEDNGGIILTGSDETTINYYFKPQHNQPSDIRVVCNGVEVEFDVAPYIEKNRTMIPIRGASYLFGATTHWDQATQTVTIEKEERILSLTVGENTAYINGEAVDLGVPIAIHDGRIMVPLRFIGEGLLTEVHWDDTARTIFINCQ